MRVVTFISIFLLVLFHTSTVKGGSCKIGTNASYSYPVCAAANGSITISPSNGTAPYSYFWSNGASTATVTGLVAGSYTLTISDAAGCTAFRSFSLTASTRSIILTASGYSDTCNGGRGKATLSISGNGNAPFTYVWSNDARTATATGLTAGGYTILLTDSNGCSVSASANVTNFNETINVTGITTSPICTASNGSVSISPSGGMPSYSYNWSGGSSSSTIQGLAHGSYIVTVTDVYGCSAAKTFTLTAYMRPMSASAVAAADTCTAHIGKVTATVNSGGNAPYTYFWSNAGTTNPITGLGAHYYTVVVTDSNGCSATAGASVSNIGTPIVISGVVYQPLCYGNTGSVSITATGGTSNNYSALWSNGSTSLGPSNLQAGNYIVTVSGTNGCTSAKSYTINAADSITLKFNVTNINCDSDAGGAITLTSISGAAYPWFGTWAGPAGFSSNSLNLNHLNTGNYTINLTDGNRCSSQATYTITSSGFISPKYIVTNTSCPGAGNGAIGKAALIPYSSPVYIWSGPNGFTSDSSSLKNLAAGIYNLTITEAYGCSGTSSDTVKAGPVITLTYSIQGTKCDSAIGGFLENTSIAGATYPWTASWTGPYGFTSNSVSINRLTGGKYHLNFTDALGCTATGNYMVDSSGALNVNYGYNNIYCSTDNGSISYQSLTPYSSMATYHWTGSNGFTSNSKSISGLSTGNYSVTVTENFGCQAIRNFTLTNTFDVGVVSIKYINMPAPGQKVIIHPIAGDMSQVNGQHCAAGISGQVQMIVTGPVHYQGITAGGLTPASVHGDTITWNVADFGTLKIDSGFFVVFNTDSNAVPGSDVCTYVSVTPLAGDNNPSNNTSNICLIVIRPYDPNEKQVFPDGNIDITQKSLTYTVLFQNTGTAPAQNVYVLDTLDVHLDPATFKVIAGSFPVQSFMLGNAVKFNFPGINLPDSSADADGSRGWVQYTADIRDNMPLGTEINNTAYIYFDLNSPVVTNTTTNIIVANANTAAIANVAGNTANFSMSPNPAHNTIQIKTGSDVTGGRLEIIDALGRTCISISMMSNEFTLPLNGLAQGMYLVNMVNTSGGIVTRKLIVE